jgi:ribosomal protein S18 acetylase RimI-like enzyme
VILWDVDYRPATSADAQAVSRLHADSWRRAYRGMYTDEFLDGDLDGERLGVWAARLSEPPANQYVLLAQDAGRLAGFVCGYADDDPAWGSLIDNLHVSTDDRRKGIASELMKRAAQWFAVTAKTPAFYLWVLEGNTPARRFYEALGATHAETESRMLGSGNPGRVCRYVWPDALSLGRPD